MDNKAMLMNPPLDLRWMLDRIPAGAYTCDARGLITYWNANAVEVWGREPHLNDPRDRFCGSFHLYTPDGTPIPHEDCWMGLALRNERQYDGEEIVIERQDGSRITVLAHASPFYDAAGNLAGAVNVLVDITDRKRSEEALQLADRRKDDFLAMLSHEMSNPLATLVNSLQVLNEEAVSSSGRKALDVMNRQLGQLVRLVDDLIDVSRITLGRLELRKESVELLPALEAAIEANHSIITARQHKIVWDLPGKAVQLSADPDRLTQIFSNLITNAAKYTPDKGEIRIEVKPAAHVVTISVIDTGIGIPLEMQDRIFDNFTQLDASADRSGGGLGIGLNVARQLVRLHGGGITACSDGPGTGSTFTVTLPVAAAHPEKRLANCEPAKQAEMRRVLVVDDNADLTTAIALLLEQFGHEVQTAHDGLTAVRAAETFRPDAVLLDVGMPHMNGYEVAESIRSRRFGANILLIAMTGWSKDEVQPRCSTAGFDVLLEKPIEPSELRAVLARPARQPCARLV